MGYFIIGILGLLILSGIAAMMERRKDRLRDKLLVEVRKAMRGY